MGQVNQLTVAADLQEVLQARHSVYIEPTSVISTTGMSQSLDQLGLRLLASSIVARHTVTREFYDSLVDAFRQVGENYTQASRLVGCNPRMAKRGWTRGWASRRNPWAKAISKVLAEEAEAARAALLREQQAKQEEAERERQKAREDAVNQLKQEGQMLQLGRANVLSSLLTSSLMLPGIKQLATQLNNDLLTGQALPTKEKLRALRDWGWMVRQLVTAANQLIDAERLRKGEPTEVIGIQVGGEITLEEAAADIEEVAALAQLARERGLIVDVAPAVGVARVVPPAGQNGSGGSNGTTH